MIDKRLIQTLVGVYGFYDKELTEFAIRIWTEALEGFEMPVIERAFSMHLKDPSAGRWLPKPADIIRQIKGDEDEQARMAWAQVLGLIRSGGYALLDVPEREAVHAMGGSHVIGRADESQNGFLERRFIDFYKGFRRRKDATAIGGESVLKLVNKGQA